MEAGSEMTSELSELSELTCPLTVLRTAVIIDLKQLNDDILLALPTDPIYLAHLENPKPNWSIDTDKFLKHHNRIYIPDSNNLRL